MYDCCSLFLLIAKTKVKIPILPANILNIKIICPARLKCLVIPVDNPTFVSAEQLSKKTAKNGLSASVISNKNVDPAAQRPNNKRMEIVL